MMRSKILLLIVLIAPMIILLGMAAYSQHTLKTAPQFILPIEGYDPRDPVYGHYFQFQIKWPWRQDNPVACAQDKPEDCAVCFQEQKTKHGAIAKPVIAIIAQKDIVQSSCLATLDGLSYFTPATVDTYTKEKRPPYMTIRTALPNRFYIDEKHGKPLEDYFRAHPQDFAIQVRIHNNSAHLENLLINDRDYRETLP